MQVKVSLTPLHEPVYRSFYPELKTFSTAILVFLWLHFVRSPYPALKTFSISREQGEVNVEHDIADTVQVVKKTLCLEPVATQWKW